MYVGTFGMFLMQKIINFLLLILAKTKIKDSTLTHHEINSIKFDYLQKIKDTFSFTLPTFRNIVKWVQTSIQKHLYTSKTEIGSFFNQSQV